MDDPMRHAGQHPGDPGQQASPHVPPQYGQQPYYGTPPYYGAPPYYGSLPYGAMPCGYPRPTNSIAVIALIMTFTFTPLGIVFGAIARRQVKRTGEQGWGLATAALWISVALCATGALIILSWIVALIQWAATMPPA